MCLMWPPGGSKDKITDFFHAFLIEQEEAGLTKKGALLGVELAGWFSPALCASLRAAICCSAA